MCGASSGGNQRSCGSRWVTACLAGAGCGVAPAPQAGDPCSGGSSCLPPGCPEDGDHQHGVQDTHPSEADSHPCLHRGRRWLLRGGGGLHAR
eukprot:CAMPEP_0179292942 /NCGR_PEP_ID=MMETSP0797-20121207/43117_1 /TAXON_ID=47934 /ORGANISM="Dinophysis acuminata, Strain DAEP01" /LENGTH=91 /DNA_ID=CAMNT_0021002073 /DNA_START=148 /DNA_END=419 /DNA_ORIENTATION=-